MANSNIVIKEENTATTPLEGNVVIYINEEGQLKQKNSDGTEYTIYCSNN